jgi:hypothetical protein
MKKWLEYLISELFSNRKCHGLCPWLGRPRLLWLMVNESMGSRQRGRNRERGEHGDPGSGLTRAQVAMERRRDGGDE